MLSYINFEITALLPSCHYLHDISAESPGRVFTKEQIYSAGWNDDYAVDDNAIRVRISKLREKRSIILCFVGTTISLTIAELERKAKGGKM